MKVFLSWSGERSKALALALREWLSLVLHYVEPWTSQSDIDAGERWANKIAKELEASNFGIISITRENISSDWILFEAGALARSMEEGRVIPLLLDLDFKEVTGPLAQFQAKKVDQSGIREVAEAINKLFGQPVPANRLSDLLEMAWPKLEKAVSSIPKPTQGAKPHNRPQAEILEELVASVRGLDIRYRELSDDGPRLRRRRFPPRFVEEVTRIHSGGPGDPINILLICSFLRDELPWIYELGVEVYRTSNAVDKTRFHRSCRQLLDALRSVRHGPVGEMFLRRDTFELVHFAVGTLEREVEESLKRRRRSSSEEGRPPENALIPPREVASQQEQAEGENG